LDSAQGKVSEMNVELEHRKQETVDVTVRTEAELRVRDKEISWLKSKLESQA
jgi:hypothetical protein